MQAFSIANCRQGNAKAQGSAGIADVIEAIGAKSFEIRLSAFLNALCGADHCAMFQLRQGQLSEWCAASYDGSETAPSKSALYVLGGHWLRDPMISEVARACGRTTAAMIRFDPRGFSDPVLRETIYGPTKICERIVIFSSRPSIRPAVGVMSILRSERRGPFSQRDVAGLAALADVLFATVTKHTATLPGLSDPTSTLRSLDKIELCLSNSEALPRRELQVCARTLLGMTTTGIALDLAIGEETVSTYRKRTYERLCISSRHELLLWFLAKWGQWAASPAGMIPHAGRRPPPLPPKSASGRV